MADRVQNSFVAAEAEVRNTQEFALQASGSAAVTANGNSGTFDVSNNVEGLLYINISAVSGTSPTINFYFETLDFNTGNYFTVPSVTIAQQTAAGSVAVAATNFGEKVRLRWVVGGTSPSFTFAASFIAKS